MESTAPNQACIHCQERTKSVRRKSNQTSAPEACNERQRPHAVRVPGVAVPEQEDLIASNNRLQVLQLHNYRLGPNQDHGVLRVARQKQNQKSSVHLSNPLPYPLKLGSPSLIWNPSIAQDTLGGGGSWKNCYAGEFNKCLAGCRMLGWKESTNIATKLN